MALAIVAIGFGGLSLANGPDSRLDLIKGYKKWDQATEQPTDMTPALAVSCVGPRTYDQSPNPHVPRVFAVYVNKIGKAAMMSEAQPKFPIGTVIVKEKYVRADVVKAAMKRQQIKQDPATWAFISLTKADIQKLKPELLTVMVKTKSGWEYFAVDHDGKVMDGDTTPCRSCHEDRAASDYVFRPYVNPQKLVIKR